MALKSLLLQDTRDESERIEGTEVGMELSPDVEDKSFTLFLSCVCAQQAQHRLSRRLILSEIIMLVFQCISRDLDIIISSLFSFKTKTFPDLVTWWFFEVSFTTGSSLRKTRRVRF